MDLRIRLDARQTQPLARAFTLARGDTDAVRLVLTFVEQDETLGNQEGDYVLLSLRQLGTETSRSYLMVRKDNTFVLELTAEMTASQGLYLATAVLYAQDGSRLTVGRFCYAVRDDLNLPADDTLAEEQVALIQQALGAVALLQDQGELLTTQAQTAGTYAQAQGDYAKTWGDAAKTVVSGIVVTWDTLPGRPEVFPPAAHQHVEITSATAQATADTLVKRDANGCFQAAAPLADGDVARKAETDALHTRVDTKADSGKSFAVTFTASGWVGTSAPYTQSVAHADAQERIALVGLQLPTDDTLLDAAYKAYARIDEITVAQGTVSAVCRTSKPETDVTVAVSCVG